MDVPCITDATTFHGGHCLYCGVSSASLASLRDDRRLTEVTTPGGHDVFRRSRRLMEVTMSHGRNHVLRTLRCLKEVTTSHGRRDVMTPHGRHDVLRMSRCLLYFATTVCPQRRAGAAAVPHWPQQPSGVQPTPQVPQGRPPFWTADANLRPWRRHDMT